MKGFDMDHEVSPSRAAETLQHEWRHWEAMRKNTASRPNVGPPRHHALTIALSREAGTQETAVGQEVGKRLGWPVYDHELLERIARDMRLRQRLLESVDEKEVGWLQETFQILLAVPHASESAYVHCLIKTVLALGLHGECVIIGRGAAFILPAATTLRVRLIAPLEDRSAMITQRLGVPHKEATRQVEVLDRERNAFVQHHFFRDPADPRNYDLVLNCTRFGVVGSAKLIVDALDCLQTRVPHGSEETLCALTVPSLAPDARS
jgi:cytidylate kinase